MSPRSPSLLTRLLVVVLGAAGCASHSPREPVVDPLFRLRVVGSVQPADAPELRPASADEPHAFALRVFIRRAGNDLLAAPAIVAYPRQRAHVTVANQLSFVQTFETVRTQGAWTSDPVIGVLQDGVVLEAVVDDADGDDLVAVAFRIQLADLLRPIPLRHVRSRAGAEQRTIQLPKLELTELVGARRVHLGTTTRLAVLGREGEREALHVLARIERVAAPATEPGSPPRDFTAEGGEGTDLHALLELAVAASSGELSLTAIVVDADLEPGELHDGGAAEALLGAGSRTLRRISLDTLVADGAVLSAELQESYLRDYEVGVVSEHAGGEGEAPVAYQPLVDALRAGLRATVIDGDMLHVEWRLPQWKTFTTALEGDGSVVSIDIPALQILEDAVPLREGRRLLPLARLASGGTAAVVIDYAPRRTASHTQATRNVRPSALAR